MSMRGALSPVLSALSSVLRSERTRHASHLFISTHTSQLWTVNKVLQYLNFNHSLLNFLILKFSYNTNIILTLSSSNITLPLPIKPIFSHHFKK